MAVDAGARTRFWWLPVFEADQVDLLTSGKVQPGTGIAEVGTRLTDGQAKHPMVELEGQVHVADEEAYMGDAKAGQGRSCIRVMDICV